MNVDRFRETDATISLHGLGFLQVKLPGRQRLHVWHPDLPRRDCYDHSAIHNHRFSFISRVLKGTQKNVRVDVEIVKEGTHQLISHNGPRSEKGGRLSYPVAQCLIHPREMEIYQPGNEYYMPQLEYHHTPVDEIVVTIISKQTEGRIHANSVCANGVDFHYDFDRFQMSEADMWGIVTEALGSCS
jgi:hypothetical protein